MDNNITQNPQEDFLTGIEQVSEIIRKSYGPNGSNVSIEQPYYPYHILANDAQSIIQAVHIEDPVKRRGLNFLKELSDKATKDSGEGRKTTIIIAETLLKEGLKLKKKGMELKEELDLLSKRVIEEIEKNSTRIEIEDIGKVAKTSSRSEEIGSLFQEIYNQIGREGIIEVEGSETFETSYKITDGVKFKYLNWISPYMAHNSKNQAIYEKPVIIISKKKIDNLNDINALLENLQRQNKRDIVIVAHDIESTIQTILVRAHHNSGLNILVLKPDVLYRDFTYEDFAACVGAKIISDETGITLKTLKMEDLGTCDKLIADGEDTILLGIKDIKEHKKNLEEKGDNDSRLRLDWLSNKSAIIKLGAGSESELSYKMLKVKDAINACRLALEGGVVQGAGLSMVYNNLSHTYEVESVLIDALEAPFNQLVKNGLEKVNDDVKDPTIVITNAIKNAVSLAGIVLTTEVDIRLPDKSFEDKQLEILANKQARF